MSSTTHTKCKEPSQHIFTKSGVNCEQLRSEHGRLESSGDSADAHKHDAVVDSDSRTKLEQLVKRLQNEVVVSWCFFFSDFCVSALPYVNFYLQLPCELHDN